MPDTPLPDRVRRLQAVAQDPSIPEERRARVDNDLQAISRMLAKAERKLAGAGVRMLPHAA